MRRADLSMIIRVELSLVAWQAKITEFDSPVVIDKNVLGFQITMEKLAALKVKQCDSNLLSYFCDSSIVKHDFSLV